MEWTDIYNMQPYIFNYVKATRRWRQRPRKKKKEIWEKSLPFNARQSLQITKGKKERKTGLKQCKTKKTNFLPNPIILTISSVSTWSLRSVGFSTRSSLFRDLIMCVWVMRAIWASRSFFSRLRTPVSLWETSRRPRRILTSSRALLRSLLTCNVMTIIIIMK